MGDLVLLPTKTPFLNLDYGFVMKRAGPNSGGQDVHDARRRDRERQG